MFPGYIYIIYINPTHTCCVFGYVLLSSGPTFCALGRRPTPPLQRKRRLKPCHTPLWWVATRMWHLKLPVHGSCSDRVLGNLCCRCLFSTLCYVPDVSTAHTTTHDGSDTNSTYQRRNGRTFPLLDVSIVYVPEMSLALYDAEVNFNRAPVMPPATYLTIACTKTPDQQKRTKYCLCSRMNLHAPARKGIKSAVNMPTMAFNIIVV